MSIQARRRATIGVGFLFSTLLLTGCSHNDQAAAQNSNTSAQIQQTAQQQAAQRAAYFNSHPTGGAAGQNPAGAPYRGHP